MIPNSKEVRVLIPHRRWWAQYCDNWHRCFRCPLGQHAAHHVLGRGNLPCDILFIGEAPGSTEDLTGWPFVGRSGKLLGAAIESVWGKVPFTWFITNTVACCPRSEGGTPRPPELLEILHCRPRLEQLVPLLKPKGSVLLGRYAQSYVDADLVPHAAMIGVYHPAYVLRMGGIGCEEYVAFVSQLKHFVERVMVKHGNEN